MRLLCIALLSFVAGCATPPPAAPPDRVASLLEVGEGVNQRMPAQLLHGHDMQEPDYDAPEGYRPIPA